MISLPIGIIATILIVYFSADKSAWGLYVNVHSMVIVIGGLLALIPFTTPLSTLKNLIKDVFGLFGSEPHIRNVAPDLINLVETRRTASAKPHPLLSYASDLWLQGTTEDLFEILVFQKKNELENEFDQTLMALKSYSKYPPALGMMGTVMGLVSLFSNLDAADKSQIGPSLGLALTATFFGLTLSNLVVVPLADRLQVHQAKQRAYLENIFQVLCLINHRESATVIKDEVAKRGNS